MALSLSSCADVWFSNVAEVFVDWSDGSLRFASFRGTAVSTEIWFLWTFLPLRAKGNCFCFVSEVSWKLPGIFSVFDILLAFVANCTHSRITCTVITDLIGNPDETYRRPNLRERLVHPLFANLNHIIHELNYK